MDPRIDQRCSGHHRLVTHLVTGRIGKSAYQGVLGPILVDRPGLLDGHRFPGGSPVIAGEPLQGGAAGDVHLDVSLGGFHALGELVFAGQISACGLIQIAY